MTKELTADVLIVGGGAAGCFAAIKARQAGADRVLLVDKAHVGKSGCSKFAAGSFKCFIPAEDDFDLWFSKAVEEGYYINDQEWTQVHLSEVYERAQEMESWGLSFIKDAQGRYQRLEGQGSSDERPIKTMMFRGPELMDVMRKAVRAHGAEILDRTMITRLLQNGSGTTMAGAYGFDMSSGDHVRIDAKAVVLTAGAQGFKTHYAYQKMVTGDAHVMALHAGASLTNYEFCCHHLSCADFDTTGMNVLQGRGARFVNAHGDSYMRIYDPEYGDHAAMNRLSAAMACEVFQGKGPIYYDFSSFTEDDLAYFEKTLPIMYRAFERAGYIRNGRIKSRVEWVSANMGNVGYGGGIRINTQCETGVPGLYAAGDATGGPASGVEGFCAYAIPFAVTSGARSGTAAARYAAQAGPAAPSIESVLKAEQELIRPIERTVGVDPDFVILKVQELIFPMETYLLRRQDRLESARRLMRALNEEYIPNLKAADAHGLRSVIEAANMAICGEMFLTAALARTESRGSHLRVDYPEVDNEAWLKWIILSEKEGRLTHHLEDIPLDRYPKRPERKKYKHPVAEVMERLGRPLS